MAIVPGAPQINAIQLPAVRGVKQPHLGVKAPKQSRMGRYRTRVAAPAMPRIGAPNAPMA
jgi:hypothetical protein